MHELSIAVSLVEAAQEEALKHGATAVVAVHLKLGALSGVVKDALLFSYDVATENTPLKGSKLVIEELPVEILCPTCGQRRPIRSLHEFCCAVCDAPATEIVQGKEIQLAALEIDT